MHKYTKLPICFIVGLEISVYILLDCAAALGQPLGILDHVGSGYEIKSHILSKGKSPLQNFKLQASSQGLTGLACHTYIRRRNAIVSPSNMCDMLPSTNAWFASLKRKALQYYAPVNVNPSPPNGEGWGI